jgi:RNA polymerase sigma-70 factor, ECF subfamily
VSEKRGGHLQREKHSDAPDLDRIPDLSSSRDAELVAIHDALDALARIDIRKARVVELRFFGGLSVDESAEVLAVSPQTVMRDWKLAKAWLTREMTRNDPGANRRSSE